MANPAVVRSVRNATSTNGAHTAAMRAANIYCFSEFLEGFSAAGRRLFRISVSPEVITADAGLNVKPIVAGAEADQRRTSFLPASKLKWLKALHGYSRPANSNPPSAMAK